MGIQPEGRTGHGGYPDGSNMCIHFRKGFFNLMPILFAIIAGYLVCLPLGFCDFTAVRESTFPVLHG